MNWLINSKDENLFGEFILSITVSIELGMSPIATIILGYFTCNQYTPR